MAAEIEKLIEPKIDVGLYDSDTGASLEAIKVADVTEHTDFTSVGERAFIAYTEAKRGRIAQLHLGSLRIHYFFDEAGGRDMIVKDTHHFGFKVPLLRLIEDNAPAALRALSHKGSSNG